MSESSIYVDSTSKNGRKKGKLGFEISGNKGKNILASLVVDYMDEKELLESADVRKQQVDKSVLQTIRSLTL